MDPAVMQKVIEVTVTQGPWAVLFVALLFYVLRESGKRENRLLDYLSKLDMVCAAVTIVQTDVADVKNDVKGIKAVVMHD